MPVVVTTVVIQAPPDAVSDVLLDIDATPSWTSGLESFELIEGEPGRAGCVGLAHYVEGGRRYAVEDRLLESVPGSHFKSEIEGGGLRAVVETDLDEVPGGTKTTIRWSGTGTNPLTKLMLPFLKKSVAERCREDLQALRSLVEARESERT